MKTVLGLVVCAVALATLPVVGGNYVLSMSITFLMYGVLALSWNMIGGFAGYPSFGLAGFFGLGAYVGGILLSRGLITFPLSPIAAAVVCFAVAFAVGTPILRLRGHYFAVASLAIGEVFREIATNWTDLTGGGMGLSLPILTSSPRSDLQVVYAAMAVLACVALAVTVAISRSKLGVGLRCIRQNEQAANLIGINVTLLKVIAFALSAAFAGAAGAVYASWVTYIDPGDVFGILRSIEAPIMVLIGGFGTTAGPLVGAAIYFVFRETASDLLLNLQTGALGLIIVALIVFAPEGVLSAPRFKPLWRLVAMKPRA